MSAIVRYPPGFVCKVFRAADFLIGVRQGSRQEALKNKTTKTIIATRVLIQLNLTRGLYRSGCESFYAVYREASAACSKQHVAMSHRATGCASVGLSRTDDCFVLLIRVMIIGFAIYLKWEDSQVSSSSLVFHCGTASRVLGIRCRGDVWEVVLLGRWFW